MISFLLSENEHQQDKLFPCPSWNITVLMCFQIFICTVLILSGLSKNSNISFLFCFLHATAKSQFILLCYFHSLCMLQISNQSAAWNSEVGELSEIRLQTDAKEHAKTGSRTSSLVISQ